MLYTPLEKFQITLLFSIKLFCFDFSISKFIGFIIFFSSNENYLKETSFFLSQLHDKY